MAAVARNTTLLLALASAVLLLCSVVPPAAATSRALADEQFFRVSETTTLRGADGARHTIYTISHPADRHVTIAGKKMIRDAVSTAADTMGLATNAVANTVVAAADAAKVGADVAATTMAVAGNAVGNILGVFPLI
ncbi:hypothetical protein ACP70R_004404 [Stipagrostis hirtigluma subsp. patula]